MTVALLMLAIASCCPDGENFGESTAPQIAVEPIEALIEVDSGQTSVGNTITIPIRIQNTGNGDLTISDIALAYTAPDVGDQYGPAFVMEVPELPQVVRVVQDTEQNELNLVITYTRQDEFAARRATLIITSDSVEESSKVIELVEQPPSAVGDLSPKILNFGTVKQGDVQEEFANMTNTGTSPLVCGSFKLTGHPDYTLHNGDKSYPVSEVTNDEVALETPITVAPGTSEQIRLTFNPQTASPAQGSLVLFCNDIQGQTGHVVVLVANEDVPCIAAEPASLDFGGQLVGIKSVLPLVIRNCGDSPLRLSGITLGGESPDFQLNFESSPIDNSIGIPPDAPLELAINESIEIAVEFVPDVVNGLDGDNKPIPDTNFVLIENNSFEAELEVPLTGVGVEVECPTAIAVVEEGEQVVPQTVLHLEGEQSFSSGGADITGYAWTVKEAPDSDSSQFIPSEVFANPVYSVNVAGKYEFCLTVTDTTGTESCEPACVVVIVIPDEAIHVELTWTTEGDTVVEPDEGIEGNGTDMDLHFAHPYSTGPNSPNPDIDGDGVGDPWFHEKFDCFWYNKAPNWGTFDPAISDDPTLDRDDFDGWGPENLNIDIPEEGSAYQIGVHYWNHHGYGDSLATLRVYIYGELDIEVLDVPMTNRDMWYVGEIPWAAGTGKTEVFTDDEGAYLITPNYTNPAFLPPF